jgi:hypothetical protein
MANGQVEQFTALDMLDQPALNRFQQSSPSVVIATPAHRQADAPTLAAKLFPARASAHP